MSVPYSLNPVNLSPLRAPLVKIPHGLMGATTSSSEMTSLGAHDSLLCFPLPRNCSDPSRQMNTNICQDSFLPINSALCQGKQEYTTNALFVYSILQWLCTCLWPVCASSYLTTHPGVFLQEGQSAGAEPGQCKGCSRCFLTPEGTSY